jgi:hypothetical protein
MNVSEWLAPALGSRVIPEDAPQQLTQLLTDLGMHWLPHQPARMSADEALRLWGLRLRNIEFTGKSLHGAARLVDGLRHVPAGTEIEQFGFMGDRFAGAVLFDGRDHQYLGAVVVER